MPDDPVRRRCRGQPLSGAGPVRRLFLWRHGQTAWNAEQRFQGHADVPLDAEGLAQARAAAALLAAEGPDLIVTSDLSRASQTARLLARETGLPVRVDPRLRETGLGGWEGLTGPEIEAAFPAEWARWRAGEVVRRGGGELRTEVAARALAAVADLDGEVAVMVTHGGTAKVLLVGLLGLPEDLARAFAPLANCHWTALRRLPSGWRLDGHNIGPHPERLPGDGGEPPALDAEDPAVLSRDVPDL